MCFPADIFTLEPLGCSYYYAWAVSDAEENCINMFYSDYILRRKKQPMGT